MPIYNNNSTGFKPLNLALDVAQTTTLLHEAVPMTGTIISGSYGDGSGVAENIKVGGNQYFISVYDYFYASSSANPLFTVTAGWLTGSTSAPGAGGFVSGNQKNNMYAQQAQEAVGYDINHTLIPFNASGVLNPSGYDPDKKSGIIVYDFSRVVAKDEIKMGSFQMTIGTGTLGASTGAEYNPFEGTTGVGPGNCVNVLSDAHADPTDGSTYKDNSPLGNYAFLQLGTDASAVLTSSSFGLIYYQAAKLVLWADTVVWGTQLTSGTLYGSPSVAQTPLEAMVSSSIPSICNGALAHTQNIQFNNTTKLNSKIYFCRANAPEFNYSSNPTYTSSSQIVVKNNASDPPISYVTSVGLYNDQNELLAVAKVSEPLMKDTGNEMALRVRLDY